MYEWTVWRLMANSVVLAGFFFVTERVDVGGKDQVEIPGITDTSWTRRKHHCRIAGRDEVGVQSVHVTPFSYVSRFTPPSSPVPTRTPARSAAWPSNVPRQTTRR